MKIVQLTPGAGGMYCGGCFRDNALVKGLRRQGHDVLMVPLYLPLTLEDEDQSKETPIFYGGIGVFLRQYAHWLPSSWTRWLSHRSLLSKVAGKAARTRPEDTGALTISMLRGLDGRQAGELNALVDWLKQHGKPDVVCLSNALLLGMCPAIKRGLGVKVVCTLQGEDTFLDALREPYRTEAWDELSRLAAEVDAWIAPSQYYGRTMQNRLNVVENRIHVVPNGIPLEGYQISSLPAHPPVLGYFARMCPQKGLDTLVDAFCDLKNQDSTKHLKLMIGGGCGPGDVAFVESLKVKLQHAGLSQDVTWHPNLSREEKLDFFSRLTLFSVPALYGESFGLYVLESLASGVPVVQPPHAAFPEIIAQTGGGILSGGLSAQDLSLSIKSFLMDRSSLRAKAKEGRESVLRTGSAQSMCDGVLDVFKQL